MHYFVRYGLDLIKGTIRDNKEVGVLEPAMIKIKSIRAATEAAISLLRIGTFFFCGPSHTC